MKIIPLLLFIITLIHPIFAQDPESFETPVKEILQDHPHSENQGAIVFTGSSSIRMWKDLEEDFPRHQIINTGFGGSHTSDLLYYIDELILDYKPKKVFIYEGDNDLASGKSRAKIMETLNLIITQIELQLPETEVILISAKPSIARWDMAKEYLALNLELKTYSLVHEGVEYADVWTGMLGDDGIPREDIFLEDNLHLNRKGYDIWKKEIERFLR